LTLYAPATRNIFAVTPGANIVVAGDSLTVTSAGHGWAVELLNYSQMLYGDSVTWTMYGAAGTSIAGWLTGGQAAAVVALNPTMIIIELGVNFSPSTRALVAADATALIAYFRAHIPNVQLAWAGLWSPGSEQWGPTVDNSYADRVVGGVLDACVAAGIPYIDEHFRFLTAEADLNSPPPGVSSGIVTYDGLHPNWRGQPMMGVYGRPSVTWLNPIYPEPDWSTWTPDTDVTPLLWIEADQLTALNDGDPVSTWSSWTAAGAKRPTYQRHGWFDGGAAVYFNGTNVMTAPGLSIPTGPKTIFAMAAPTVFSTPEFNWQTLCVLKNAAGIYTNIISDVSYNLSGDHQWTFNADLHVDLSTGTPMMVLLNPWDTQTVGPPPSRISATYNGGNSDLTASYKVYSNGWDSTIQHVGFGNMLFASTALTTLGGGMNDGVNLDHPLVGPVKALLVYPGILTTAQRARVGEYLRRKGGP
jgi:hypothetical protein